MGGKYDYSKVFHAYDVRGVYGKEFDLKFAYDLGRALVMHLKAKDILVGRDGRISSPKLMEKLIQGIKDQGAEVIDMDLCSTPEFYFAMSRGKYSGGAMITASHDPKEYNGFKIMAKGGISIHPGNGSLSILKIIEDGEFPKPKTKGKSKKKSWTKEYSQFLESLVPKTKSFDKARRQLKVVIDQSNGVGIAETKILQKIFPSSKVINSKVSGTFPGHDPDPLKPDSRKKLAAEIKKEKADVGAIFDGDADRVCFLDEKGCYVRPDAVLNMLCLDIKNGKIIYDTRMSQSVQEICSKRGLEPMMSKAGHSSIFEAMKNDNAPIGGESSGHYYFKEFNYLDSGGVAAIKLLSKLALLKLEGKTVSSAASENSMFHHSDELNYKIKNQGKAFLLVEQAFTDPKKILFIDGLSVYYEDRWFNIRKSNTEPLIRVNAEAHTKEGLDELLKKINKVMGLAK